MQLTLIKRIRQVWPDLSLRSKGLVVVSIPLVAMLLSAVFSYLINRAQDKASGSVARTLLMRADVDKLLSTIVDAEAGARGYLRTGSDDFLALFRSAQSKLPSCLAKLSRLTAEHPNRRARVANVRASAEQNMSLLKEAVEKSGGNASGFSPADREAALVDAARGLGAFRREVDLLDAKERRLEVRRSASLARIEYERSVGDTAGVLFGLGGALVAVQLFSKGIATRVSRLQADAILLAQGLPIQPGPAALDELGMLARELEKASDLLRQRDRSLAETMSRLSQSESLYRAFASNFPNGSVFLFDQHLRLLVADGRGLVETGPARESIEGHTIWEAFSPELAAALEPLYQAALDGVIQSTEIPFGERLYNLQTSPLRDEAGKIYAGLAVTQDITERKTFEENLRAARDEAERANRAKSVFLSRMSHELRTPLNAILGFGQLLELGDLEGENAECVTHILKGGRYLLTLIDEVLDIARVESGELVLKLQPVAFEGLAHECIAFVARMAQASKVTCHVEPNAATSLDVMADEHRLRQVMLNLLSNAIKYNREGGTVTLSCEVRPDNVLRLKVADTGIGVSPEGLAKLFVPFERLGQEYGEVEGTGLGLIVSKNLIEAMNGKLGAESELGQGTCFWVDLPAVARPASLGSAISPALKATNITAPAAATILYIEDNTSNLKVLEMAVNRSRPSWRFLSAVTGDDGLKQARVSLPEVVLLDLQLPGMNGEAVLEALQGDAVTRDVPVLILSADATAETRNRLIGSGAAAFVSKPFAIGSLLNQIEGLFSERKEHFS